MGIHRPIRRRSLRTPQPNPMRRPPGSLSSKPPSPRLPSQRPTSRQRPGIISAAPVGWIPPPGDAANAPAADGPVVPWSAPAAPLATAVGPAAEGVVIARVFPRIVAYVVDVLILGALGLAVTIPLGLYNNGGDRTLALVVSAVLVVVDLVYFVGLWTSRLQATLGMRLLRLRVLNAATAGSLPFNDALLRWLGLTGAIGILALVPGIDVYIVQIGAVWVIVLLITTASDRLRQGLHDKWARSVVVQPAPGGSGLAFATCLVLVGLSVALLFLGTMAATSDWWRTILSQVGNSV